MDDSSAQNGIVESNELRQRLPQRPEIPQRAGSEGTAKQVVVELNSAEETADKSEKDKKTFGRTPDGTGTLEMNATPELDTTEWSMATTLL